MIGYIGRNELKPQTAWEFAVEDIRAAQEAFLEKAHIGKIMT